MLLLDVLTMNELLEEPSARSDGSTTGEHHAAGQGFPWKHMHWSSMHLSEHRGQRCFPTEIRWVKSSGDGRVHAEIDQLLRHL